MATALLLPLGVALAQGASAPHSIPAGTALTFVSDDAINAETVKVGGQFRVHLKTDVSLDGITVMPAGATARFLVLERAHAANGAPVLQFALDRFHIPAGYLPVAPTAPTTPTLMVGSEIAVTTLGTIERGTSGVTIRVPLPFSLPVDVPASTFTAIPFRTPQPRFSARPVTPRPLPSTPAPAPSSAPTTPLPSTSPGSFSIQEP